MSNVAAVVLIIGRMSSMRRFLIAIYLYVIPVAWGEQKNINQDGVAVTYDTERYSRVEIVESKKESLPRQPIPSIYTQQIFSFFSTIAWDTSVQLLFTPWTIVPPISKLLIQKLLKGLLR